jgi:hypothetical protein
MASVTPMAAPLLQSSSSFPPSLVIWPASDVLVPVLSPVLPSSVAIHPFPTHPSLHLRNPPYSTKCYAGNRLYEYFQHGTTNEADQGTLPEGLGRHLRCKSRPFLPSRRLVLALAARGSPRKPGLMCRDKSIQCRMVLSRFHRSLKAYYIVHNPTDYIGGERGQHGEHERSTNTFAQVLLLVLASFRHAHPPTCTSSTQSTRKTPGSIQQSGSPALSPARVQSLSCL